MAELVIHGIVTGQEISKCDKLAYDWCGQFYTPNKGIRSHIGRLADNRIAYSLLFYEDAGKSFTSYSGRSGSYFGMTLFFKNQQIANPEDLFKILLETYNNYVKGKIITESPDGSKHWAYPTLNDSNDTVAKYLSNGLQQTIKKYPNLLKTQPLPPLQKSGRDY